MKLSICVVTMNRAAQLKEALESCLACELPKETEFVVIDNASTDNTEEIVNETLKECGFTYYYEKLPSNIGAGAGRNVYFEKAQGEFIYGMDDDAVIDYKCNPNFFIKAIKIMEDNAIIGSLATQIYDNAWKCNRQEIRGPKVLPGIYMCKMFCGGSHFLRKNIFSTPPYFANRYGHEELPPSLKILDAKKINVFCPDLVAIHNPLVDKWDMSKEIGQKMLIVAIAAPYAITKMMYPIICRPILWLALKARFYRFLRKIPEAKKRLRREIKEICLNYSLKERIKLSTVVRMVKEFGLSAF